VVTFDASISPAARALVVRRAGATLEINYRGVAAASVTVPNTNALAALERDPAVVSIVPDRLVSAYQGKGKPNGGGGGGSAQVVPAGVARVGVPTSSSNGGGVAVAILDTGVDLTHADLWGSVDAFSAFGGSCQDDNGHGTHVAGTVAARDNSVDVIGVAPNAQLYCVKVLDGQGSGSDSTVMAGLDWVLTNAAGSQIKVVNMSLGRPGSVDDNPALHALVSAVVEAGITIVVAAGNDASMEISEQIPAGYSEVIPVASTTASTGSNQCRFLGSAIAADTASYFTTDGAGVAVSAPGEDKEDVSKGCLIKSVGILSTRLGGGTTRMSGTSMAAPHVSGIAARYYQQALGYTPSDIRQFLQQDAEGGGTAPLD
jgi:subtilisin